jgi:Fe-S cluster biogenesis protein NfuA
MEKKIKKVIKQIRPYIQSDGGDIEYVGFNEKSGVLEVRLLGACVGCPMSQITMQEGVGKMVKEEIPEVTEVVMV